MLLKKNSSRALLLYKNVLALDSKLVSGHQGLSGWPKEPQEIKKIALTHFLNEAFLLYELNN